MNINEIPHHLFFYKGTRVTEFGQQYRIGKGSVQYNEGLNYILSLLDITTKPTRIGIKEILDFQEQVRLINPVDLEILVPPDEDFIDALTNIQFRLDVSHVAVSYKNGSGIGSDPVKSKLLYINFAKLAIIQNKARGIWSGVEDIASALKARGNNRDKMAMAINSSLAPEKAAKLKELVTVKGECFNQSLNKELPPLHKEIILPRIENEFSKFIF